jgi:hypothetical protein
LPGAFLLCLSCSISYTSVKIEGRGLAAGQNRAPTEPRVMETTQQLEGVGVPKEAQRHPTRP